MNAGLLIGMAARRGRERLARLPGMLALLAVLALPCGKAMAEVRYHHDIDNRKCCLVIAHAGGGIEGNPYTNSEEALFANLKDGVKVFELDFAKTLDGKWVCTHDWGLWKTQTLHAARRCRVLCGLISAWRSFVSIWNRRASHAPGVWIMG